MAKSEKKEQEVVEKTDPVKEETVEDKLKISQDKLLRAMAEMENQRRRFEKEKQEAFEFGGFNFAAESLLLIDNIDRAIASIPFFLKIDTRSFFTISIPSIILFKSLLFFKLSSFLNETIARSILSISNKDSAAKLKPPNSNASCFSFSNLLL